MESGGFHRPPSSAPACTLLFPLLPGQPPPFFRAPYMWLLSGHRWCSWGCVQCLELLADDVSNQVRNLCFVDQADRCGPRVFGNELIASCAPTGHAECHVPVCVPLRWFVHEGDRAAWGQGTGGVRLGEAWHAALWAEEAPPVHPAALGSGPSQPQPGLLGAILTLGTVGREVSAVRRAIIELLEGRSWALLPVPLQLGSVQEVT